MKVKLHSSGGEWPCRHSTPLHLLTNEYGYLLKRGAVSASWNVLSGFCNTSQLVAMGDGTRVHVLPVYQRHGVVSPASVSYAVYSCDGSDKFPVFVNELRSSQRSTRARWYCSHLFHHANDRVVCHHCRAIGHVPNGHGGVLDHRLAQTARSADTRSYDEYLGQQPKPLAYRTRPFDMALVGEQDEKEDDPLDPMDKLARIMCKQLAVGAGARDFPAELVPRAMVGLFVCGRIPWVWRSCAGPSLLYPPPLGG